jgi:hypothetical protein
MFSYFYCSMAILQLIPYLQEYMPYTGTGITRDSRRCPPDRRSLTTFPQPVTATAKR